MRAALLSVCISVFVAACFSPTYREGIACAPATQECPPGMSCDPRDGRCYRDVPAIECLRDEDCASQRCDVTAGACVAATCMDGIKNGAESDVDCGGNECPVCPVSARCAEPADCESMVCAAGLCAPASCGDGVVHEGEACDDAGASTSCDPDCTPVVCGDGVVNEAAGEVCDVGRDACCAATCDAPARAGSECRAADGPCDTAEVCDGFAVSCPDDPGGGIESEDPEICGSCTPGETISCYTGAISTRGVGLCQAGIRTCVANGRGYGLCAGEVTPKLEDCSTPADENCDGTNRCVSRGKRGLTWVQYPSDSCGQTRVTCDSSCDPYDGDTLCTEARPILCLRVDQSKNCGEPASFYNGWSNGTVALTPRLVYGTELTSLAAANAICEAEVGPGFRIAEHHDGGGGWGWRAKGMINPPPTPPSTHPRSGPNAPNRFWVHVDGASGNCWN